MPSECTIDVIAVDEPADAVAHPLAREIELRSHARTRTRGLAAPTLNEPPNDAPQMVLVLFADAAALASLRAPTQAAIAEALGSGRPVVPVKVADGQPPTQRLLPPEIASLALRHAVDVRAGRTWSRDVGRLVAQLPGIGARPDGERRLRLHEQDFAPIWRRLLSTLVDLVVLVAIPYLAIRLLLPASAWSGAAGALLVAVGIPALALGVSAALLMRSGVRAGQTLGRQLLGIRVVTADGAPLNAPVAFNRVGVKIVQLLFCFLVIPLVGMFLYAMSDEERRSTNDRWARTLVVRATVLPFEGAG